MDRAVCSCGKKHRRFYAAAKDGTEVRVLGCPDCIDEEIIEGLAMAARLFLEDLEDDEGGA